MHIFQTDHPTPSPSTPPPPPTTENPNAWNITITEPSQEAGKKTFFTVTERLLDVEGLISPYTSGNVEAIGFGVVAPILPNGVFRLEGIFLPEGQSEITCSVSADDGSAIGEATLLVKYIRPSEVSGLVSVSDGGEVEVIDQDSPIAGAKIQVPPTSAMRNFTCQVIYDPQHVPLVPFEYISVGPPVLFTPETEAFNGTALLTIPFNNTMVPDSLDSTHVKVLSLTDDGWEEVLNSFVVDETRLSFEVATLDSRAFVGVVKIPLQPNQVLVETMPTYATIYIDGVNTAQSPAIIDTTEGTHSAKIYLPGYNELFFEFNASSLQGFVIKKELEYPVEPLLLVQLDESLDGLKTLSSFVEVTAHVQGAEDGEVGVISANGMDFFQEVRDGKVQGFIALNKGHNHIMVCVNGPDGNTGVSHTAIITREIPDQSRRYLRGGRVDHARGLNSNEIKIVLTWDTGHTGGSSDPGATGKSLLDHYFAFTHH